jgi:2'-5' RNA ligase
VNTVSNYVVIVRFDEETDNQIMKIRKIMLESGYPITEWPPHITIAAYENIDERSICEWTSEVASRQFGKMNVALNSLSILPPKGQKLETAVLCFNPAHSKAFVDFYYKFHEKYEEYCTGIGWFNSVKHGHPVIHATIGTVQVNELQKALEIVFQNNFFKPSLITALEVYTYPMKLIGRFEINNT